MKKGEKKWYKVVHNWVLLVAFIILVPMLVMNLAIMVQGVTNKDKVPSVFGVKPFMVLSGSMEPEIHKGDIIFTKVVDPETLAIDDVIAFRDAANTVTTHRIIDIVEDDGVEYFITKGDNNSTQDRNLVEKDDVEGIYIARIPSVGNIMQSLSQPTTVLILVLGITVIFIIGFSISNKKQREMERQEFLEFKMMKELQEKKNSSKKSVASTTSSKKVQSKKEVVTGTKKTSTKKSVEAKKPVASKKVVTKSTSSSKGGKTSTTKSSSSKSTGAKSVKKPATKTNTTKGTTTAKKTTSKTKKS